MVNIKTLPDRIIFDGHADTAKECETITLMCDGLACNDNFRTVAYRKGYAEFEKVGAARELKFVNAPASFSILDSVSNEEVIYVLSDGSLDLSFSGAVLTITDSSYGGFIYSVHRTNPAFVESISQSSDSRITTVIMKYNIEALSTSISEFDPTKIITFESMPKLNIDLTTLSGYSTLQAGSTYAITVKAKASGYTDSDASASVNYTVPAALAAPTITASDTTITWDAVENAESYDVYMDGELYENVTGGVTPKGYTISWTGGGNSHIQVKVKINGADWQSLSESTGSIDNVETLQFYTGISGDDFYAATVKSTTLNLNQSGNEIGSSSVYTLTEDISDIICGWEPRKTT